MKTEESYTDNHIQIIIGIKKTDNAPHLQFQAAEGDTSGGRQ